MSKYKPYKIVGPGYTIKRNMEASGWTQKDLSEIIGVSEKHISQIINNKEPITLRMAKLLSEIFGTTPQFWINLDINFRLRNEKNDSQSKTATRALIYKYMPIRDMRKKGWIAEDESELEDSVKEFWDKDDFNFDFLEKKSAACFRKSSAFKNFNPYYALCWLRKAEIESKNISVPKYNSFQLKKLASKIPEFSLKKNGIKKFVNELKLAGVKFLFLQHLEKTYTDGAVFYNGKNPVIIYTARYNRDDNFWFTITHEIGHVLKHLSKGKKEFIDCLDNIDQTNSFEKEANNYAENILKTAEIINYFRASQRITETKINKCSEELKISRPIIVGVLHYNKMLPYSSMRETFSEVIEKIKIWQTG